MNWKDQFDQEFTDIVEEIKAGKYGEVEEAFKRNPDGANTPLENALWERIGQHVDPEAWNELVDTFPMDELMNHLEDVYKDSLPISGNVEAFNLEAQQQRQAETAEPPMDFEKLLINSENPGKILEIEKNRSEEAKEQTPHTVSQATADKLQEQGVDVTQYGVTINPDKKPPEINQGNVDRSATSNENGSNSDRVANEEGGSDNVTNRNTDGEPKNDVDDKTKNGTAASNEVVQENPVEAPPKEEGSENQIENNPIDKAISQESGSEQPVTQPDETPVEQSTPQDEDLMAPKIMLDKDNNPIDFVFTGDDGKETSFQEICKELHDAFPAACNDIFKTVLDLASKGEDWKDFLNDSLAKLQPEEKQEVEKPESNISLDKEKTDDISLDNGEGKSKQSIYEDRYEKHAEIANDYRYAVVKHRGNSFEAYHQMAKVYNAYRGGIEVNGRVPSIVDVSIGISNFLQSNMLETLVVAAIRVVVEGVGDAVDKDSKNADVEAPEKRDPDPTDKLGITDRGAIEGNVDKNAASSIEAFRKEIPMAATLHGADFSKEARTSEDGITVRTTNPDRINISDMSVTLHDTSRYTIPDIRLVDFRGERLLVDPFGKIMEIDTPGKSSYEVGERLSRLDISSSAKGKEAIEVYANEHKMSVAEAREKITADVKERYCERIEATYAAEAKSIENTIIPREKATRAELVSADATLARMEFMAERKNDKAAVDEIKAMRVDLQGAIKEVDQRISTLENRVVDLEKIASKGLARSTEDRFNDAASSEKRATGRSVLSVDTGIDKSQIDAKVEKGVQEIRDKVSAYNADKSEMDKIAYDRKTGDFVDRYGINDKGEYVGNQNGKFIADGVTGPASVADKDAYVKEHYDPSRFEIEKMEAATKVDNEAQTNNATADEEPRDEVEAGKEPKDEVEADEEPEDEVEAGKEPKDEVEADEEPEDEVEAGEEPEDEVEADEEPEDEVETGEEPEDEVEAGEEPEDEVEAGEKPEDEVDADEEPEDEVEADVEPEDEVEADEEPEDEVEADEEPEDEVEADEEPEDEITSSSLVPDDKEETDVAIGEDGVEDDSVEAGEEDSNADTPDSIDKPDNTENADKETAQDADPQDGEVEKVSGATAAEGGDVSGKDEDEKDPVETDDIRHAVDNIFEDMPTTDSGASEEDIKNYLISKGEELCDMIRGIEDTSERNEAITGLAESFVDGISGMVEGGISSHDEIQNAGATLFGTIVEGLDVSDNQHLFAEVLDASEHIETPNADQVVDLVDNITSEGEAVFNDSAAAREYYELGDITVIPGENITDIEGNPNQQMSEKGVSNIEQVIEAIAAETNYNDVEQNPNDVDLSEQGVEKGKKDDEVFELHGAMIGNDQLNDAAVGQIENTDADDMTAGNATADAAPDIFANHHHEIPTTQDDSIPEDAGVFTDGFQPEQPDIPVDNSQQAFDDATRLVEQTQNTEAMAKAAEAAMPDMEFQPIELENDPNDTERDFRLMGLDDLDGPNYRYD